MEKKLSAPFSVLLIGLFAFSAAAGEPVPLLKELRKPVEVVKEAEEAAPLVPSPVGAGNRISELATLCPDGAVWYMSVPDAARLTADWKASAPGTLMDEPAMTLAFRNNRFGVGHLFADLPESIITPERVGAMASLLELCNVLAEISERMSMACYIDDAGQFRFLFLFDVGLNREPAFNLIGAWETSFFLDYPGSGVWRGVHSGNYLDIWRPKGGDQALRKAEIAAGFAENVAIVSNDAALAQSASDLVRGGANLSQSRWGQRLAASVASSATADIISYVRMDALLAGLESTPIVRDSVISWADYFGAGNADGEAIYYGVQFIPDGSRETFLLPTRGGTANASLVEILSSRLGSARKWSTPAVLPYQPNPAFFVGAMLDGRQLGGLLRQERRIFGVSANMPAFTVPDDARAIFTQEVITLLTGEIGLAFFPSNETSPRPWIMVLPCKSDPKAVLPRAETTLERSEAVLHSMQSEVRSSVSWTTISPESFRRVQGNYLLVASEGELLVSAVEQLLSGSTFAQNKDFTRALSQAEAEQGLVFYINLPEVVIRVYPRLAEIMRSLYPRSSGLNNRPPLALLRRYGKGIMGVVAPATSNNGFTRVTVQSPLPTLGAIGASTVLQFPRSLRLEGRIDMETSKQNLQNLWLRLQLYSSRFGHFPDTLEDLRADMMVNMLDDEIRAMMTAPGALSRMSAEEAMVGSYHYLSGVTPNDEPDVPLVYEAEPWSEDFSGRFPVNPNRAPVESGEYLQYRQFIRLDGKVESIPERRFQEVVLPRLRERE